MRMVAAVTLLWAGVGALPAELDLEGVRVYSGSTGTRPRAAAGLSNAGPPRGAQACPALGGERVGDEPAVAERSSSSPGGAVEDTARVPRAVRATSGELGGEVVRGELPGHGTADDRHTADPLAIRAREREQAPLRRRMVAVMLGNVRARLSQRAGDDRKAHGTRPHASRSTA